MKKILRFTLFTFFLFVLTNESTAQGKPGSYKIISSGSANDIAPYKSALDVADMDKHRLRSKRAVIKFDKGVIVELFSAEELLAKGYDIKTETFDIEKPHRKDPIIFSLAENNYIIELYSPVGKH